MNKTLSQIEQKLLEELQCRLAPLGLTYRARNREFVTVTSSGSAAFHLSFIRHKQSDFDVTLDVAVRIDRVEELISVHEREESKGTSISERMTVGGEFGNISTGRMLSWNVSSDADIAKTVEVLYNAIVSIGLPFIKRFSDMTEALSVLSHNDRIGFVHSPFHEYRCKRAIAIAYLLDKQDALKALIEGSLAFLRSINDHGAESVRAFATALRESNEQTRSGATR